MRNASHLPSQLKKALLWVILLPMTVSMMTPVLSPRLLMTLEVNSVTVLLQTIPTTPVVNHLHICMRAHGRQATSTIQILASSLNNSAVTDRLSSLSALSSAYSKKRETNQLIVQRRYIRPFGLLHCL